MNSKKLGEFALIDQLTHNLPKYRKEVIKGVGDDCAVLVQSTQKHLLITCDVQVEGVHFSTNIPKPEQIGKKAIAVNISDIAAMGGKPTFCLVSLIIPRKTNSEYVDSIYSGIRSSCKQYDIQIIGGNISTGKQLAIDIFMMGEVRKDELLLRSGAKPGDKVMVTGSLGGAAASLALNKHFIPQSRLTEASIIAKSKLSTAMIDISDGLLSDIGHVCDQSNVGVVIHETQILVPGSVTRLEKQLHKKPLTFALTGGEDYELLFTAPSGAADKIIRMVQRKTGTPVSIIGEVLPKANGRWVQSKNGQKQPLISTGWDHLGKKI